MQLDKVENYIRECTMCYVYYVEHHLSYDKVAKEVLLKPSTVKRRLIALQDIDKDMYDEYIAERRLRKNGSS